MCRSGGGTNAWNSLDGFLAENIARMSSNPTVRQGSQVEEGQIAVRLDDTPLQYLLKTLREQIARTFRER